MPSHRLSSEESQAGPKTTGTKVKGDAQPRDGDNTPVLKGKSMFALLEW
jgi:hypothetical protein